MGTQFYHGTSVTQSAENLVITRTTKTATAGLLVTAPDADAVKFPLNKPILLNRPSDAEGLGDAGSAKDAIDTLYDQKVFSVVLVRVEEGATLQDTWANMMGNFAAYTGIHAFLKARAEGLPQPKRILAPGWTASSPADGIASVNVTVAGGGYTQDTVSVAIAGATGSGAEATATVATDGSISSIIVTKPGYGYTGPIVVTISDTGVGAGATADGNIGTTMNPIVAEAIGVCDKLRARFFADGPDTTDQAAVQYRQQINSKRIFVCDPKALKFDSVTKLNVPVPSSPIFVGQYAKSDIEQGFWHSGSNKPIAGIVGMNRPVVYGAQSNYLNENRVNTIVNIKTGNGSAGYRTWGVWTCSSELLWQFEPVVAIADAINEEIEEGFLEFVDKPMTKANLVFVVESARAIMRKHEKEGAILPGSEAFLSDKNTPEEMAQGIIKLDLKYEPVAPMVDIRITAHRNIAAYTLLLKLVNEQIGSGAVAA